MKNINKKLLAALVLAGVLSIAGAAFADVAGSRVRDSSLIGGILHIIVNNDRPSLHHHRAQTPPPPPEFRKGHRPPPPDGKRPPMSGDKRPPEPPREPKVFKPHMPPHRYPMARR